MELYGQEGAPYRTHDSPFTYGRTSAFYEATDGAGDRVCVKMFRELDQDQHPNQNLDAFLKEIALRHRANLTHPKILPIIDYGIRDAYPNTPFLVLPFCPDGDLRRWLASPRGGPLARKNVPIEEALGFLRPVAEALDFAHQRGIVHGDVKPENILFRRYPSDALLADFGAARWITVKARVSGAVGLEPAQGTESYLSPEELEHGHQTGASDIYSFGVVAFEVLTGEMPFDLHSPPFKQMEAKVKGHLRHPSEVNPGLSKTMCDALECALSVRPQDRPRTALNFCDMLVGAVPPPLVRAPRPGLLRFWQDLPTSAKATVIVGALAALATIIAAAIAIIPDLLGVPTK